MPRFHSDSESDDYPPRHRSPRRRTPTPGPHRARDLSPDDAGHHHPHFEYEPHTPFYPVASGAGAAGAGGPSNNPPRGGRGRSAGPSTDTFTSNGRTQPSSTLPSDDSTAMAHHHNRAARRSSSSSFSSSPSLTDNRHRTHHRRTSSSSHNNKARGLFSASTSGLGVGVLGAIVGGLAAREASEAVAASSSHHGGHGYHGHHHHKER
ncbi:hypothetical protein C8A00DRAFT_38630, partial [Chaetomidium leptoderma]